MSDTTERAAGVGPGVFEFGGRSFVLHPVTGPDMLALHSEFRRQCLAAAKDPLTLVNERIGAAEKAGKPFSATVADLMVRQAMSAAARTEGKSEPSDDEVTARLNTLDGSRFLVWYRLHRADPSVTREWVAEHLPDMNARNVAFADLMRVDGLSGIDPKKA